MKRGPKPKTNFRELEFTIFKKPDRLGKLKEHACCNFCNKAFSNTSKVRLSEHRFACIRNTISQADTTPAVSTRTVELSSDSRENFFDGVTLASLRKNKQSSLDVSILSMKNEEVKKIRNAIAKFFYSCNVSFLTAENEYFRDLLKLLKPEFIPHIPNR